MATNVLLLGRTGVDLDAVRERLARTDVQLFGGRGADDARSVLDRTAIDHVIMGAGIDIDVRLAIISDVFSASNATTVHMKDRVSAKAGMIPFVTSVLHGLEDYQMEQR